MTVLFKDMTSESKGNGTIRIVVKVYPYCPEDGHPFIFPETEEGSVTKRMLDGSYNASLVNKRN
jgi:hypothetical protein